MGIEVMGKSGNGNAVLEWESVGMGMGMIRWEWEGNRNKRVITAHLYSKHRRRLCGCFMTGALIGKIMWVLWVLSTRRNLPSFCIFLHQNSWILCVYGIISWNCTTIAFTKTFFSAQNAPNVAWWLDSARICWES